MCELENILHAAMKDKVQRWKAKNILHEEDEGQGAEVEVVKCPSCGDEGQSAEVEGEKCPS
ncbi:hypothetical protein [Neobacillus sp. SAB-20_R2A]|uniref:hypothetical protein n=1 Tax=Neobacillus sp. SAB-20_R2A TaxID=3120519 RepID=UPI003C6E5F21